MHFQETDLLSTFSDNLLHSFLYCVLVLRNLRERANIIQPMTILLNELRGHMRVNTRITLQISNPELYWYDQTIHQSN